MDQSSFGILALIENTQLSVNGPEVKAHEI